MAAIDVRSCSEEDVDTIFFSDDFNNGTHLRKKVDCVELLDMENCNTSGIALEDIDNIIKALQKAKELGW